MVTFSVIDHAPRCLNNDDGQIVFNLLYPYIKDAESVEVSFEGVYSVTSSFINSAFIALLDIFDFEQIKQLLKVTNSNAHINRLIKQRFSSAQAAKILH